MQAISSTLRPLLAHGEVSAVNTEHVRQHEHNCNSEHKSLPPNGWMAGRHQIRPWGQAQNNRLETTSRASSTYSHPRGSGRPGVRGLETLRVSLECSRDQEFCVTNTRW